MQRALSGSVCAAGREREVVMSRQPSTLLTCDDLCDWYNLKRGADVLRYLRRDRVRYTLDKDGRPVTTVGLIESALAGIDEAKDAEFDFDVAS